ncbi:SDR family oxidoreductase [bacterium]|nr:SDR family oxidoreductase [bacterium]
MRILVTGTSGFLGWNLARHLLANDQEVHGAVWDHPGPLDIPNHPLDLTSPDSIRRLIQTLRPDAVIHCAAMSRGDDCEIDPELARRINAEAVAHLADVLAETDGHLVHCSTDLVFDGTHPPYREDDPPSPRHAYGRSKAAGEEAALAARGPAAVARLALLFGDGSPASGSFLRWLDAGLRTGKGVTMFRDEIRTALYVEDAAAALLEIVHRRWTGLIHLAGPESMSREEFARLYAITFDLDASLIQSASLAEAGGTIYRPPNVSLEISLARNELGFNPLNTEQALTHLRKQREKTPGQSSRQD